MQEAFVQAVWQHQLFAANRLCTLSGEPLEIVHPGILNTNAGPDFYNARVRIGNTLWAGEVEIHLRSSDFDAHRHADNPAYHHLILHVVWEHDRQAPFLQERGVPTLVLKDLVPEALTDTYLHLVHGPEELPCSGGLSGLNALHRASWLDRMLSERLSNKAAQLEQRLGHLRGDWESMVFQALLQAMGFSVNALPMEWLGRRLPLGLLQRHAGNPVWLEALLLGQAGFLECAFHDAYAQTLQSEYLFLKRKHNLQPISTSSWKFHRLRPANFPTLRLVQVAAWLHAQPRLGTFLLEAQDVNEVMQVLDSAPPPYWQKHYRPGVPAALHSAGLGEEAKRYLLINAIVPLHLLRHGPEAKALEWLRLLSPEQNRMLQPWKTTPIAPKNAAETQALYHLYQHYCLPRLCSTCHWGAALLKNAYLSPSPPVTP